MKNLKKIKTILLFVWIVTYIGVYVWNYNSYLLTEEVFGISAASEVLHRHKNHLILLTGPVSLIAFNFLEIMFTIDLGRMFWITLIIGLFSVVQWFILIPYLWKKAKEKWVENKKKLISYIWIALFISFSFWNYVDYENGESIYSDDIFIRHALGMLILNGPACILSFIFIFLVKGVIGEMPRLFIVTALNLCLGYLQWFKLTPWLWNKFKLRKKNKNKDKEINNR